MGGQGLSGARSLPKGQGLPGQTLWATGGEGGEAEGEGLQSSKSQETGYATLEEREGKVGYRM